MANLNSSTPGVGERLYSEQQSRQLVNQLVKYSADSRRICGRDWDSAGLRVCDADVTLSLHKGQSRMASWFVAQIQQKCDTKVGTVYFYFKEKGFLLKSTITVSEVSNSTSSETIKNWLNLIRVALQVKREMSRNVVS